MTVRRAIAGLGQVLIALGVLILLFVAYQLWGTNIAEARSNKALRNDFDKVLRAPEPDTTTTDPTIPPPPPEGEAVAIIKIPRINVEKAVIEGVGVPDLKKGPGHYPESPMPGQPGNAAIAGHRTTYGAPFYSLDSLQVGDPIIVTTRQGRFRYEVRELQVVRPNQVEVLKPSEDNRLTLTTCEPRFSAAKRLVAIADLKGPAALAPPPSPRKAPPSFEEDNLSGDRAPARPAILWGAIAAGVWLLVYLLSRLWRKWPAYILGTPVFLFFLYFFFENFARLLPANY